MSELPDRLRALRALVERLTPEGGDARVGAGLGQAAKGVVERLDRDLLPRTAGGHNHLVVGIVGPNNAGKSALFNALAGRVQLSPSLPTGGATRHLVGAASAELARRLAAEPTLAQFPIRPVRLEEAGKNGGSVLAALDSASDAAELFLVEIEDLPSGVLLIDTPDFDSVLAENRAASESLLKVVDLAIVVVTRHTYQNREVVQFLEAWLSHERPWLLVYNESLGADITREHAQKLASDLASPPVAVFHAPFAIEVSEGKQALEPRALPVTFRRAANAPADTPRAHVDQALGEWLSDLELTGELKSRALAASLSQLEDELAKLAAGLEEEARLATGALAVAETHARRLGAQVASQAMPMAPFLQAFREVLDRRPNLVQRGLRGALRKTRLAIEKGVSKLPFGRGRAQPEDRAATDLADIERRELEPLWPSFYEGIAVELRAGGTFWGQGEANSELAALLAEDLAPGASEKARESASQRLEDDPDVLRAFQTACAAMIETELEERGGEWFFQLAVDALHLLPAVAAGVVIFHTGGLGSDIAVGGAGAFSSLLAERLSKLLGTRVAHNARERWTRLRGERLAKVFQEAVFERSGAVLRERKEQRSELAAEMKRISEDLSCTAIPHPTT